MQWKTLLPILSLLFWYGCVDELKDDAAARQRQDFLPSPYVWGYIDHSGKWIIAPKFDDCRDFREGLAPAMERGLWGYIDKKGHWVIQPKYLECHAFHNGLAKVKDGNGLFGAIDSSGNLVVPCEWQALDNFTEEWTKAENDLNIRYIKPDGSILTQEIIKKGSSFQNGRAVIEKEGKAYILDEKGHLSGPYQNIMMATDLPYPVLTGDEWNWLKADGTMLNQEAYDEVYPFQNGLGIGAKGETYWVVDNNGSEIFSSTNELESLGRGWLAMYDEEKEVTQLMHIRIDTILRHYDEIHPFIGNRAAVLKDTLWTYLRPEGVEIRPPFTAMAWSYCNDYARVIMDKGIGIIDTNGQLAMGQQFFEVKDFHEGLARAQWFRK